MANDTDDSVDFNGTVIEACRGGIFRVLIKFGETEKEIMAYPSGKMRKNNINIVVGDFVTVKASPYSLDKGRIVFRNK